MAGKFDPDEWNDPYDADDLEPSPEEIEIHDLRCRCADLEDELRVLRMELRQRSDRFRWNQVMRRQNSNA